MPAQLTTGTVEGTLRDTAGNRLAGQTISIAGVNIRTNSSGEFSLTLPYGTYRLFGESVVVGPMQTTHVDLIGNTVKTTRNAPLDAPIYPEGFSLQSILLSREPSTVTEPLDFAGLSDNRLPVESQRGFSWTDTQYKLQGLDATDSWQPGFATIFPDADAIGEIEVRPESTEVGVFLRNAPENWHGSISTVDTGAAFSSTNLPPPALRGLIQQADQFRWFTRDGAEIGGPITRWADLDAAATGQWSSQTEPLRAPGTAQGSRLLFGNARGQVRVDARNRIDALYSGSRIDLSDGGIPVGLEALTGNRMAPSFVLPGGFPGQGETDHFDFVQVGWIHLLPAIEVRYGYSVAHLDTSTSAIGQSGIELLGGTVSGPPPIANLAVRTRQQIAAAWRPFPWHLIVGGGWKTSEPRNRFTIPSDTLLITAAGAPAFVMDFNTPLDSRERVRSFSGYVADHVSLASLSLDLGAYADFSRGSVPGQGNLIAWNSVSPRAGFAWQVPRTHGFILRGEYSRLYRPLAGRYLDFGDPNGLSGNMYQFQGPLVLRFGGAYSSISPTLERPYSDTFDVGAQFHFASIHLFRRDDKNRIAAIDTGVPAQAFSPVAILDTFDNQPLTVYAQNPATFGQDRYLLTNPPGLRMLNTGFIAETGTTWRGFTIHASFVAGKSYGPTNPGDAFYENDPGVIGALFLDPNTSINASNRSFFDRAYVGKMQAAYRLPARWGGMELATVADYTDGLVFARQLLVTGLPQGPLLVASTVRGSPEGGNRAQYAINWNLRLARRFEFSRGRLSVAADIMNVTNAGQSLQENDLSSPSFNLRLPVSIQPPRFVRLGFRYDF